MKNTQRRKQRQRQKVSRKTIVLICAAAVSCMMIGTTLFFYMTHVDVSKAASSNVFIVGDQEFTTEKNISAPVTVSRPGVNSNTVFVKHLKQVPEVVPTKNNN